MPCKVSYTAIAVLIPIATSMVVALFASVMVLDCKLRHSNLPYLNKGDITAQLQEPR